MSNYLSIKCFFFGDRSLVKPDSKTML